MRDKMKNVSLRTKLIVACTAMVLIPLVLTLLSFLPAPFVYDTPYGITGRTHFC